MTEKQRDTTARAVGCGVYSRVFGVGFLLRFSVVLAIIAGINFLFSGFMRDNFHYVTDLFDGWGSPTPIREIHRFGRARRRLAQRQH